MNKETVWIEDIVDAFVDTDANWKAYLKLDTAEILFVPLQEQDLEEYSDEEKELFNTINENKEYLPLLNQKELREFDIMEQYANDLSNPGFQHRLLYALHNGKPFRNFRGQLRLLSLEEDYEDYRYIVFAGIARNWCMQHEIPFQVESEDIKKYFKQIEEEEQYEKSFEDFEESLGEFEYEEEMDDYFE